MIGPIVGTTGASKNPFPIYQQLNEPTRKEGIWVKTTKKVKDIYVSHKHEPRRGQYKQLTDVPCDYDKKGTVAIGTDIYIFSTDKSAYKYDTLTGIYTRLTDLPYVLCGQSVAIGTDIYLFCVDRLVFKYDTLTNTYSQLANTPHYYIDTASIIAVGTDIYMFGGSDNYHSAHKYDTLTNKYTTLKDYPNSQGLCYCEIIAVENSIYLFGNGYYNYGKEAYKYDIPTNTYKHYTMPTDLIAGDAILIGTNIYILANDKACKFNTVTETFTMVSKSGEVGFVNAVKVGTDICLFGSHANTSYQQAYNLNTLTDTFEQLVDIPYGFEGNIIVIGDVIYLIENYWSSRKLSSFKLNIEDGIYLHLDIDNSANIEKLFENVLAVYVFENNEKQNLETYVGDGTKWNKLEQGG